MAETKRASEKVSETLIHAESRLRDSAFVMSGHHCHSCYELFYAEMGDCRFLIDDRIYDLHAGDFILVPPMALHYTRYLFGPCRRTVVLFRREDIAEVFLSMPQQEHFWAETRVFRVPEDRQTEITGLLSRLIAEDALQDSSTPLMRRLLLQTVFLFCARCCSFVSNLPVDIQTTDSQILAAASYIGRYYMNPLTTAEVAAAVGFSPNYLSRKFRRAAGIGLHEYLVFVRLQHAARELLSSQDSITVIALRCGFSDSNYFKDSFKKKYGVTPRQYRQMA